MITTLLLLLAIAPPAALMLLIYWMDRHEPEALKNVIMAMVIGTMSTIPAIIIQSAFGAAPILTLPGLTGGFFESFLLVAPSEELAKFFCIYLFIRKKPFYDNINDGIVYYGAGALGFALFENIFYVFDYGFSTGVLRAFTSIPIHAFCGIIIGYHAGLARFSEQLKPKRLIFRGLFLAYLTHALYNTLASAESLLTLLFLPLVGLVYYAGYKVLRRGRQLSLTGDQVAASGYVAPLMVSHEHANTPVTNDCFNNVATNSDAREHTIYKTRTWKAVIGRILLISTGLIWLLVFFADDTPPAEFWELFIGMIILTIIPFMLGLLLELSYQRGKRSQRSKMTINA